MTDEEKVFVMAEEIYIRAAGNFHSRTDRRTEAENAFTAAVEFYKYCNRDVFTLGVLTKFIDPES